MSAQLACVVMAHTDPPMVRRLVEALAPFPVFLHCDARTPDDVFAEMVRDLPQRVTVMPRQRTGWARWENVSAELAGVEAALTTTDATHVAVMTGTDYPLRPAAEVLAHLQELGGSSVAEADPLPIPAWGFGGGTWRLRFRFWSWRKHMLWLPVPRRLPRGVVVAGGSQMKLLSRAHAGAVLDAVRTRPELVRFWRRSWIPDETFVHSLLHTPELVPGFSAEHVKGSCWSISWPGSGSKSPRWLGPDDLDDLLAALRRPGPAKVLFARKFSTSASSDLLDHLDELRRTPAPVVQQEAGQS